MFRDLAVVFDVAGTILRMYRVAKDLFEGRLMEKVITTDLIMDKRGRALVVPQIDLADLLSASPYQFLSEIFNEVSIEISCSSTPVSREKAIHIVKYSQARIADIQQPYQAVASRCQGFYQTAGAIIDADLMEISYTICTGGEPFPGLSNVIRDLGESGGDIYIASGDSMRSLLSLEDFGFSAERIYSAASPERKRDIVSSLKEQYKIVVMVGDGLNDIKALKTADWGVLTIQQNSHQNPCLFAAADRVIEDIQELPELINEWTK